MTKIFISYRRQDSKAIAGRIFDRLEAKFGRDAVFMDIDSIPPGEDFHDWLNESVAKASVVLALIGHGWVDARDERGARRLENPNDFVRIEIEAALGRKIPVIPLLIDGASFPRADELPPSLQPFTRRNAASLDAGRDFNAHIARLIEALERIVGAAEGRIEIAAPFIANPRGRWFLPGAGKTEWFKDLENGPEMVVVPAGRFLMGSPKDEPQRESRKGGTESPQHEVKITAAFAIGRCAITRGEYATFVAATGHNTDGGARFWTGKEWKDDPTKSWRDPGFTQDDSHPVVCVNWSDAKAYIKWLSEATSKNYRLPSEAEWEYACRAGTTTPFWWNSSIAPDQANYNGSAEPYKGGGRKGEYRQRTVPAKHFEANPWGLYQVHGNVWEWCVDLWHDNYAAIPIDAGAKDYASTSDKRDYRALRGGAWTSNSGLVRSAFRLNFPLSLRGNHFGFRVARTLTP